MLSYSSTICLGVLYWALKLTHRTGKLTDNAPNQPSAKGCNHTDFPLIRRFICLHISSQFFARYIPLLFNRRGLNKRFSRSPVELLLTKRSGTSHGQAQQQESKMDSFMQSGETGSEPATFPPIFPAAIFF